MKRTDLERRERELKRTIKKQDILAKKEMSREGRTVGGYIQGLFSLLRYDEQEIFNTTDDIDILELLEEMKEFTPEKQWDTILRKAISKTKISNIANKEKAFNELNALLS